MAPLAHHPRGVPIAELGLPARLVTKLTSDDVIADTFDLSVLHPDALRQFWRITAADFDRINEALASRGMRALDLPTDLAAARAARPQKHTGCTEKGRMPDTLCDFPRVKGKRKCAWHYLMSIPIEKQIIIADQRASQNRAIPGHVERMRVPESEWPAGGRWCSECQGFIPWIYITATKCKAHASRSAHNSRLKAVYDLTRDEWEALLRYQGGRCYICRQEAHSTRLAVDHDHRTGVVRGLLCANQEWGCNVSLRRLLNDVAMAQRALEYVTMPPFDRMRSEMAALSDPEPEPEWNPFG